MGLARNPAVWLCVAVLSSSCGSSSGPSPADAASEVQPDHQAGADSATRDVVSPFDALDDEGKFEGCVLMSQCNGTVYVPYGGSVPTGDICGDKCTCPIPTGGISPSGSCPFSTCPCPDAGK
jgi:hypothetical protein